MADFVSAEITQEIIDAKNKLNQQADRAESILDSWDSVGGGDMTKFVYDPQGIQQDAFAREHATGEQAISTVTGLQASLDSKASVTQVDNIADQVAEKASTTDLTQGLSEKQDTLVSGTNIKTINGEALLGSGNIVITGGGGGAVDSVNGQTGVVVLDANDIGETANRVYFTPTERSKLAGIEAGANNYTLPSDVVQDANYVATENSYTDAEKIKLAGIAAGAEVNEVSTADLTNGLATKEDSLGNPSTDGQILSSATDGTRTWIDAPSGGGGGGDPVAITQDQISTTAALLALGSGKYILSSVDANFTDARVPLEFKNVTYNYMFEIDVTPQNIMVKCTVLAQQGRQGMPNQAFIKNVMPWAEAGTIPWTIMSEGAVPKTNSIKPDLTDADSIYASLLNGTMYCGHNVTSTGVSGAPTTTHTNFYVSANIDNAGTIRLVYLKAEKGWASSSGLEIHGRGVRAGSSQFDSGWNPA